MPQDEIANLHKAIRELKESNDRQFSELDDKLEPIIEQHAEMYQAFTTITQGGTWITVGLKYGLGILLALTGIYLSLREIFRQWVTT